MDDDRATVLRPTSPTIWSHHPRTMSQKRHGPPTVVHMTQHSAERTGAPTESDRQAPTGAHGSEQSRESESYTHGHHESVLRSHRSRTAANSAAHLVPLLRKDMTLLDVGCGPGTVTVDLARTVGRVVGVDAATAVLDSARELAESSGVENVSFEYANAYELPFDDDSFDVATLLLKS